MESEISLDVIKSTQETLGKFVKRPALSEKLLRKPPFRFLHDIVTSVIKTNGFLQGLYTDNELVSENVNNRDGKIAFLTKLIAVVSLVVQQPLSARPSKIIAGQEPEKTNQLLQSIGIALENNLSSDSAVKIYTDKSKTKKEKDASKSKENRNIKFDSKGKKEDAKKGSNVASKPSQKIQRDNSISRLSDKSNPEKVSSRDKLQTDRSVRRIDLNKDKDKNKKVSSKDEPTSRTKPSEKNLKLLPKAASKSSTSIKSLDSKESKSKKAVTNNKKHKEDVIQKETEIVSLESEIIIPNENVPHEIDDSEKATPDQVKLQTEIDEEAISNNIVDTNRECHKSLDSIEHSSIQNDVNHISLNSSEKVEEPIEKRKLNLSAPSDAKKEVSKVEPHNIHMQMENEVQHETVKKEELNTAKPTSNEMKVVSKVMTPKSSDLPDRKRNSVQRTGTIENLVKVVQNIDENKDVNRSKTLLRPPSARPPSARPGAPRLKDKNDVSSNPAEPIVSGKVNVIVEKYGFDKEDDDGSLVVVESNVETVDSKKPAEEISQLIGAGHGHLVQQILDTQSDFKRNQGGNVEIEWEFGARKAKEAYAQEIENLRTGLQAVSHASNSLGKLFDHIQEDVEVMRREQDNWKEVYKQASMDLALQRSLTEQSTLPLQSKLRQLDADILDKRDQINTLKAQMYKNTSEIDKLLDCNNVQ